MTSIDCRHATAQMVASSKQTRICELKVRKRTEDSKRDQSVGDMQAQGLEGNELHRDAHTHGNEWSTTDRVGMNHDMHGDRRT